MRRYPLSKRERKKLIEELARLYPGLFIDKNVFIEILEDKSIGKLVIANGIPLVFSYGDKWILHLKYLIKHGIPEGVSRVVVDMGAVKPLLKGADVMIPGIKSVIGEFKTGDPVVVVDEKYGKPFVVGIALIDSDKIVTGALKRGKAIENVHRVGDKFWNIV
ncbi:MAG: DUF1947 domain-containing protein [Thermoprotei archaeon]